MTEWITQPTRTAQKARKHGPFAEPPTIFRKLGEQLHDFGQLHVFVIHGAAVPDGPGLQWSHGNRDSDPLAFTGGHNSGGYAPARPFWPLPGAMPWSDRWAVGLVGIKRRSRMFLCVDAESLDFLLNPWSFCQETRYPKTTEGSLNLRKKSEASVFCFGTTQRWYNNHKVVRTKVLWTGHLPISCLLIISISSMIHCRFCAP